MASWCHFDPESLPFSDVYKLSLYLVWTSHVPLICCVTSNLVGQAVQWHNICKFTSQNIVPKQSSLDLSTKSSVASLTCLISSNHVHVATGIIMSLFRYCGQTCYSFKKTGWCINTTCNWIVRWITNPITAKFKIYWTCILCKHHDDKFCFLKSKNIGPSIN